jgi:hypothetical protein
MIVDYLPSILQDLHLKYLWVIASGGVVNEQTTFSATVDLVTAEVVS